jgi:hypothetical protein
MKLPVQIQFHGMEPSEALEISAREPGQARNGLNGQVAVKLDELRKSARGERHG